MQMQRLLYDMRFGVRMLLKSPAVTAVAVISLALGISATTVIFSVINSVLLKSLPYEQPESIVLVWGDSRGEGNRRNQVSATDVADYLARRGLPFRDAHEVVQGKFFTAEFHWSFREQDM